MNFNNSNNASSAPIVLVPFEMPMTISLAEHDRTINRLLAEISALKAERAHSVDVLTTFKGKRLSISSVQPLYTLLEDLLDGPKEMPCLPPL